MNVIKLNGKITVVLSDGMFRLDFSEQVYNDLLSAIVEGYSEQNIREMFAPESQQNLEIKEIKDELSKIGVTHSGTDFYWITKVPMPDYLVNYLRVERTKEEIDSIRKFWLWSCRNPNKASRDMLFEHCKKYNIQIDPNGMLVLYRNVVDIMFDEKSMFKELQDKYYKLVRDGEPVQEYFADLKTGLVTSTASFNNLIPLQELMLYPFKYINPVFTSQYDKSMRYKLGEIAKIDRAECDESDATCSRGLGL